MGNASTRWKRSLLGLTGVPLAMAFAPPVHAAQETTIGEVVVTATRRSENVQKVAVTVQVLGAQQLKDEHIERPLDLQGSVPGLTVVNTFSDSMPIFSLRGVSQDDIYPDDSSPVGVYYDEVYASSPLFLTQPIFDLQRVEVLKGPQGTLYGRNTSGGAINFISNKPSSTFGGYVNIGYGRWNTLEASGAVTGPLTPNLNFRLAGDLTDQADGYQTDINTGRKFGAVRRGAVRAELEYKPTSNFSALATVYGVWDNSITASAYSSSTYTGDPSKVTVGDLDLKNHETTGGGSLRMTWDLGVTKLISITAYDGARKYGFDNYDGTSESELNIYNNYWAKQFSQELRLSSNDNPGDRVSWIVGATLGLGEVQSKFQQDDSQAFYPPPAPDPGAILEADWTQRTRAIGVYAHTVTHLTDRLNFTLGVRYSNDRSSFDGVTRDLTGGYTFEAPGFIAAALDEAHTSSNVSYSVGLDYRLAKSILVYANAASGYKMGTYFGGAVPVQQGWGYTAPETVTTEEIGLKSEFLENRLLINGAVFNTAYKDRQTIVALIVDDSIVTSGLANIPRAKAIGGELEIAVKPFAGLTLRASGAYVDSQVTSTITNVRGIPSLTDIPVGTALPQTTKWSDNLTGQYGWAIASLNARLRTDYSWLAKSISALGDPNAVYGPLPQLGMSAELSSPEKHWSVSAWARNLTDSRKHTYGFTDLDFDAEFYVQKPRSYGVTFGYTF